MGNDNVNGVGSVDSGSRAGANNVYAMNGASSNAAQKQSINDISNSLSDSLTSGGKAQFASPGAQQDFKSQLKDAVGDIIKGAQSGDKAQLGKGIESLMALLDGLKGASKDGEGKGDDKASESGDSGGSPQTTAANGAGDSEASNGDDELQKLIKLLKMGVPKEMIAQLLKGMGKSGDEANSLIAKAGGDQGGDSAASGASPLNNANAIAA